MNDMDAMIKEHFHHLYAGDADMKHAAFQHIIRLTNQPVDWAHEVWKDLLRQVKQKDIHQRAVAVQILANLTKSDLQQRMEKDIRHLVAVTHDEKFATARHALLCLWKVGIVSATLQKKLVKKLSERFINCTDEKNCTLLRHDIMEVFKKMYLHTGNENIKKKALHLVEMEEDINYRKKYTAFLKEAVT